MSRRLQNLYVVEIVMEAGCVMDYAMSYAIAKKLSGYPESESLGKVIDEHEDNVLTMSFRSSYLPHRLMLL